MAFVLTAAVIAALWLGWVFSRPGASQQLGMILPEALAFLTGTQATAEKALLSWDPADKRLSLRWEGAVFASPRQPGVLAVRQLDAHIRYGWQEHHFLTIDLLRLDQPQLFLPKRPETPRSDPFLIPALKTLEHLRWPFAFLKRLEVTGGHAELGHAHLKRLEVTGGHAELGHAQALAKIRLSFAATDSQAPLLFLSGHWMRGETTIPFRLRAEQMSEALFDLRVIAGSARILSPAFRDGAILLAGARAHLLFEPKARRLTLDALHLETAGVPVQARARIGWTDDIVSLAFAATTGEMTLDQLARLWPLTAGADARHWVTEHLETGQITRALARGRIRVPLVDPGRSRLDALDGSLELTGFTVNYLSGMPPVTGASGSATFDARDFRIQLSSGLSNNVQLQGGDLRFSSHPEHGYSLLDLALRLEGRLADQLAIVRAVPAARKSDWGLDLARVAGMGITDLQMHIPLELKHEHRMTLAATSTLTGAGLPLAGGRFVLADAQATVRSTLEQVTADITGTLNRVPVTLDWQQPLTGKAPWTARLRGTGEATLWDGLAGVPVSRYASGPLSVAGQVDGDGNAALTATLTDAALNVATINWQKPAGTAATLDLKLDGASNRYGFDYRDGTARLAGALSRDGSGDLQTLNITEGRIGRSQLQGEISRDTAGRYVGRFSSAGLDLSGLTGDETLTAPRTSPRSWGWTSLPPMQVEARIARLWLGKEADPATDAEFSLEAGPRGLEQIALRGKLSDTREFSANVFPDGNSPDQDLKLLVTAHDAGLFLRTLGLYPNLRGGRLELSARLPRSGPVNADGTLRITAFSLMRAPILARLLSVASLTGPLNLLTGQGIAFDGLYGEWQLSEADVLTLRKGLMAGTSLGLQAEGTVDLNHETLDLNGAIVPVYVLSNVIGSIPILGDLLTNNQKEGLIAMRYRMRGAMSDPRISVNPLTVLTPGFLRGFFDLFKESPASPPPSAPVPAPAPVPEAPRP